MRDGASVLIQQKLMLAEGMDGSKKIFGLVDSLFAWKSTHVKASEPFQLVC